MYSVTGRIKMIVQPSGGYIPVSQLHKRIFTDAETVYTVDSGVKTMQGLVVDYMTRFLIGFPKEEAFRISLSGAHRVGEDLKAKELLDTIKGLDEESIRCACILTGYDVAYRVDPFAYNEIDTRMISVELIHNIKILLKRTICFFQKNNLPVTKVGFTMDEGYNRIISSGDGDYLTEDTLWDFKVSAERITNKQTLQVAIYYVLGLHSIHPEFKKIKYLGIYNPWLNIAYTIAVADISDDIFSFICREVIGYNTPINPKAWRNSTGTNPTLYQRLIMRDHLDTGFSPSKSKDGIYDISIDDYWSYYKRTISCGQMEVSRPNFSFTKSIKMIKKQGFLMFLSISETGKLTVLQGGARRKLTMPIEYYYDKLPEYANTVLLTFSPYWKALSDISAQIRATVPKRLLADYPFCGTIHGCIVDIDWSNHLYLNPYDGKIVPYNAPSPYEKYVYPNVASLLSVQCPALLPGYRSLQRKIKDTYLLQSENNPLDARKEISVEKYLLDELIQENNPIISREISVETQRVTDIDMYGISRKFKTLQTIYSDKLVTAWYDAILPCPAIKGKYVRSIVGETAEMRCGMEAEVIEDNGSRNIAVRFTDGTIVEHATRQQFRARSIKNPKLNYDYNSEIKGKNSYVGKTAMMRCGYSATVIEDFGCSNITVQFEDGFIRKNCRRDQFRSGYIPHKEKRTYKK